MGHVATASKGGTKMLVGSDKVKFGNDTGNDVNVNPA